MVNELAALRYARWLEWGTRLSGVAMVVAFALYLLGVLEPAVPLHKLPTLWQLPVSQYVAATGVPTGWAWLQQLQQGDMLAELGIALLAGCSLPCLLALWPVYRANGDRFYVALCCAQAAVLVVSASGWVSAH